MTRPLPASMQEFDYCCERPKAPRQVNPDFNYRKACHFGTSLRSTGPRTEKVCGFMGRGEIALSLRPYGGLSRSCTNRVSQGADYTPLAVTGVVVGLSSHSTLGRAITLSATRFRVKSHRFSPAHRQFSPPTAHDTGDGGGHAD